jgi:AcrR family transcriptional regulator
MPKRKPNATRLEIIRLCTRDFLERGYSATSAKSICDEMGISTGNLTFHFPTKEHMLAVLVDMLCDFQWDMMKRSVETGSSSLISFCLELPAMAALCSHNEIARDFYFNAYTHPLTRDIIHRNDLFKTKLLFQTSLPNWTDEDFGAAQIVVSGIEYATLMAPTNNVPFQKRLRCALEAILSVYEIPHQIQVATVDRVMAMDHQKLGDQIFQNFIAFIDKANEQMLDELKKSKSPK